MFYFVFSIDMVEFRIYNIVMENTITYNKIEFCANGLMVAVYDEIGGGVNLASFNPDGTFKGTMYPRPARVAPLRDLTVEEVLGATDIATKSRRDLAHFAGECERVARGERDPIKKLRWYELAHFARKASK